MHHMTTRDWVLVSVGAAAIVGAGVAVGVASHHHNHAPGHKRRR